MDDKEITGQLSDPKSTQIKLMIDISNRRAYDKFIYMNAWMKEIVEKKKNRIYLKLDIENQKLGLQEVGFPSKWMW